MATKARIYSVYKDWLRLKENHFWGNISFLGTFLGAFLGNAHIVMESDDCAILSPFRLDHIRIHHEQMFLGKRR